MAGRRRDLVRPNTSENHYRVGWRCRVGSTAGAKDYPPPNKYPMYVPQLFSGATPSQFLIFPGRSLCSQIKEGIDRWSLPGQLQGLNVVLDVPRCLKLKGRMGASSPSFSRSAKIGFKSSGVASVSISFLSDAVVASVLRNLCAAENVVWYRALRVGSFFPSNIQETLSEELRARVSTPDHTLFSRVLTISSERRGRWTLLKPFEISPRSHSVP